MYALLSAWLRCLLCLLLPRAAAGEHWPSPSAPRGDRRGPAAQEQEGSGAGGAAAELAASDARPQRREEKATAAESSPGASLLARLRRLWRALPWHQPPASPLQRSPMAEPPPGDPCALESEQPGIDTGSPQPLKEGPGGTPSPVGEAGAGEPGSGPVRIRVAIQAEAEEDGGAPGLTSLGGGSCSEDDSGRYGKYSGGENDGDDFDQDWKPPDNELIQKVIAQVEYYFSDENLEKDAFLLKHVRRNKMGYVSVKLLTSFKKRPSLASTPTIFSDHKMDNRSKVYLTDLGKRNFLMYQNGGNTKNIQVMKANLISTSACGPVMDRKQLSYIKVIDSIKPWRTAGKPFVCDRFSLWAS